MSYLKYQLITPHDSLKRLQEQPQSFTLRVTVTSPSIKILCHLQSEDYSMLKESRFTVSENLF